MKYLSSVLLLVLVLNCSLSAQSVEDLLDTYLDDNAEPYLQPLSDLFTLSINTGTREWSSIDSSFYIRVGVIASNAFPATSQKTFLAKTGEDFEPAQTVTAPSIIGSTDPVVVDGLNGTAYVFPGGYNLKSFRTATPQLTLGGFLNSEVSLRYFTFNLDSDLGKISSLGLGIRHSLNPYFGTLPLDLSIGYYYQNFKDDPYIDVQSHLISAFIGKSGKWWSVHLMGAYQKAEAEVKIDYVEDELPKTKIWNLQNDQNIAVELTGAVRLSIFNIHASLMYSGPVSAAVGIGLQF